MSDVVLRVENLWKQYRLGVTGATTLRDDLARFWARMRGKEDPTALVGSTNALNEVDSDYVWALQDINFEVKRGEVLGIIGKNGAGKSTLLKILSKVTGPTRGHIQIKGRVASLLEVGTGFHPELTGRENIFLNGAILGMTKAEIRKKLDEIIDFAGVAKYVDTPVKRYSSGMRVRLGFAVAAFLEPEILVVDEVLAVGDAEFQKKAIGKMQDVSQGEGRTVLFVSHQMDMVRNLCEKGLLLQSGKIIFSGEINKVVNTYLASYKNINNKLNFSLEANEGIAIQILRGRIYSLNETSTDTASFDIFDQLVIELEYMVSEDISGALVNFELMRGGETIFMSFDTDESSLLLNERKKGIYTYQIKLPSPLLKPGIYSITTNTGIPNITIFQRLEDVIVFEVDIFSKPSSLMSYAAKRKGIIATSLTWNLSN
ncbi:MAG: ABC transporter ATP-binding protein [Microscillaceae bacterium]|nr:ABC transporter ATP-binding protein [Microscillaceae bacterium]